MNFRGIFSKSGRGRTYIIAEIGGNFTTYRKAVKLINAAKNSGVDCMKLQTYRAKNLVSRSVFFEMENTGRINQYDYFKKHELPIELHKKIFAYAESKGLDWFSTPSHWTDVDMLESLGVKAFKIGADDAVNLPLLKYVAKKGKPIFLSTGMCTLEEIRNSISFIRKAGNEQIVILHTVSAYPTRPIYVNLNAIKTLQREFPLFPIGFSDHTLTPIASLAAVAIGARAIERHFTLDKNAPGPDHIISSTPEEMTYLIKGIREIEKMRGDGIKRPLGPEVKNRRYNRKSVIAIKDIKKGEIFSQDNISIKRPGMGLTPEYFEIILGKKAARDIREDELILQRDIIWKK